MTCIFLFKMMLQTGDGGDRKFAANLKPDWSVSRFRLTRASQQAPVPNKPWEKKKETKNSGINELFVYCLSGWCAMEGSKGFAVLTMFPFRSRKIPWPRYLRWEMLHLNVIESSDEWEKGHLTQIICRPKDLAVTYRLRWTRLPWRSHRSSFPDSSETEHATE